jgi:hypothetical protein
MFVVLLASVKVAAVMVAGSMGLLKAAVIFLLMGTAVAPIAGFVEVTVGGSAVTVNVCEPLVLPEPVTVTFWAPVGAFVAMVNVAVIDVLLATVGLLTVIPVPLTVIVDPVAKFVPVSVTATTAPWAPLLGAIEVSVALEDPPFLSSVFPRQRLVYIERHAVSPFLS